MQIHRLLLVGLMVLGPCAFVVADCPDTTADTVAGQLDFTSQTPNQPDGIPSAAGLALSNAAGIAIAPSGRLYVADADNNRVLSWPAAATLTTGEGADWVFGQPDMTSGWPNNGGVSAHSFFLPQGVFVDAAGNLWVADAFNHRVLKFNDPASDATPFDADLVIGQPDFTHNDENLGLGGTGPHVALPDSLQFPGRVIVRGDDVYVADSGNSRVLHYTNPTQNQPAADLVFGQYGNLFCRAKNNDGTCAQGNRVTAENMLNPIGIALSPAGTLFVADWANHRVLWFDDPLASQTADGVLGQPDMTTNTYNNGGPVTGFAWPVDIACDARQQLCVVDSGNNRILLYATIGGVVALPCTFGQDNDRSSGAVNHGLGPLATDADGLFAPSGVAVDLAGSVLVADTNNQRVLRFVRGCGYGDMNEDGVAGAADYPPWLACLTGPDQTPVCDTNRAACADLDNDGDVDLADYQRMQLVVRPGV